MAAILELIAAAQTLREEDELRGADVDREHAVQSERLGPQQGYIDSIEQESILRTTAASVHAPELLNEIPSGELWEVGAPARDVLLTCSLLRLNLSCLD